ncbi:VOC family protein [Rhodovulum visakhapatnamense]|uniref:Catechol 2,3-dioxygenase n=1 Tax=Rhodovulum visakhapatnamense TaxID=364297 RepID=A0A4R8G8X5_9RHOB|nr:VOC family protein [Rhodovulum visakhapatnamense]TDX33609.1 catechol 2,3-dioxygenase [Rhodovulum visakhapatnamense]
MTTNTVSETVSKIAPVAIDRVALTVRDLDLIGDFYQRILGLDRISGSGEELILGQDGRALIELRRDAAARPYPNAAGLFHTAFLLPHRDDLGRWLRHAHARKVRMSGASDHLVSEALYLRDPEGNGIEIYADRPRASWLHDGDRVVMDTLPLDLASLRRAEGHWTGAPEGTVIGHVHLQVGAIPEARAFYAGELGFDVTAEIPQASFFSTGGYHHHVATNTWNSAGAGMRPADATGLAELVLAATDPAASRSGRSVDDPWGNRIRVA